MPSEANALILLSEYLSSRIISAVSVENSSQAERATSAFLSSIFIVSSNSLTKYLICSEPSRSELEPGLNLAPRDWLFKINCTAAGQPWAPFKFSRIFRSSRSTPCREAAISISSCENRKSSLPKNLKLGRDCKRGSAPIGMFLLMAIV